MALKGFSTLLISPELEPYHQIQFSVIPQTPGFLLLLPLSRRCCWYILSAIDKLGFIIITTTENNMLWRHNLELQSVVQFIYDAMKKQKVNLQSH